MVDIFDWVKDIEETYKFLIDKAKEQNQVDIEEYKKEQEEIMEDIIKDKQELITYAMNTLSGEIKAEVKNYRTKFRNALKQIENDYQNHKEELIKVIIEKMGLEF